MVSLIELPVESLGYIAICMKFRDSVMLRLVSKHFYSVVSLYRPYIPNYDKNAPAIICKRCEYSLEECEFGTFLIARCVLHCTIAKETMNGMVAIAKYPLSTKFLPYCCFYCGTREPG